MEPRVLGERFDYLGGGGSGLWRNSTGWRRGNVVSQDMYLYLYINVPFI